MHKIGQSRALLNRLLGPLLKSGFPLNKNVLKQIVLSEAATAATDAAIQKTF